MVYKLRFVLVVLVASNAPAKLAGESDRLCDRGALPAALSILMSPLCDAQQNPHRSAQKRLVQSVKTPYVTSEPPPSAPSKTSRFSPQRISFKF